MTHIYVHHRITTEPLKWRATADILRQAGAQRQLSRRYDLCDATYVYTTTLLTADDQPDDVRWA